MATGREGVMNSNIRFLGQIVLNVQRLEREVSVYSTVEAVSWFELTMFANTANAVKAHINRNAQNYKSFVLFFDPNFTVLQKPPLQAGVRLCMFKR